MKGKKLFRFAAIKEFNNVLEYPDNMPGKWKEEFGNDHEIVLELACGKGEYTLALAKANPDKNYIGVDIKGNRQYVGARRALEERLKNVRFLRVQILQIDQYFAMDEIGEIWITFPDPFLRMGKAKNRLTHTRFLEKYQGLLKEKGVIHLKTDSKPLFDFTQCMIEENNCHLVECIADVYQSGDPGFPLSVQTFYEKMHLEDRRTIQYISFQLPSEKIHWEKRKITDPEEEELWTYNNKGLVVFTREYLLNRGYCCGNGCLHCPYDYKNVQDENLRTRLLNKRRNES